MIRDAEADRDVPVVLIGRLIQSSASGSVDRGYGMFRADGTPKPAALALSAMLGGRLTC